MWRARKSQLVDQVMMILGDYIRSRGVPVPEEAIDPNAGLTDFGLDSLDAVAIVVTLENHFNLALDRKQAVKVQCFHELVALIARAQEDCIQG